jgi:serine/threonine protein phosphatase PrpC
MRIGFATDKGKGRASNQDASLASAEYRCLAVADGLGGHNGGAEASNLAIGIFSSRALASSSLDELKSILESANLSIRMQAKADSELFGMGTTMTAVIVRSGKALIAHVGDSRAYLIRAGKAERRGSIRPSGTACSDQMPWRL